MKVRGAGRKAERVPVRAFAVRDAETLKRRDLAADLEARTVSRAEENSVPPELHPYSYGRREPSGTSAIMSEWRINSLAFRRRCSSLWPWPTQGFWVRRHPRKPTPLRNRPGLRLP